MAALVGTLVGGAPLLHAGGVLTVCRGCVSGKQMENMRNYLTEGKPEGEFTWELMDGLDELPEEYQAKVKSAIEEGKIADEDWKGVSFSLLSGLGLADMSRIPR